MTTRKFVRWLALSVMVLPWAAVAATNEGLNAADVYRPAFSNIDAWAKAYPDFGRSASNVTAPGAAKAYAELVPSLEALKAAEKADYVDWGTRFEDGIAATLPQVGPALKTARASNWAANYALSNNLPGFADHAIESLRLARNIGEEALLIDLLVQISAEKPTLDLLANHLDRLDEKQLAALDAAVNSMPPGGTLLDAMQMEKAMFVDHMIGLLVKAMREADTNLFERSFAADAASTNAVGTNAPAGARSGETLTPSWITENLRLTSIVDSGRGWKIGFETKDGDQFMVAFGRPSRGIELLSVDYDREEAVVARSNETVLVKLKTREIQPLRLRFRWPSPEEQKALAGDLDAVRKNPVLAIFYGFDALDGGGGAREKFMQQTGGTPDGLLALLNRTSQDYERWIAAFQRLPPAEFKTFHEQLLKDGTVFTQLMLPAVDKVIEKETLLRTAQTRLREELASRRVAKIPAEAGTTSR